MVLIKDKLFFNSLAPNYCLVYKSGLGRLEKQEEYAAATGDEKGTEIYKRLQVYLQLAAIHTSVYSPGIKEMLLVLILLLAATLGDLDPARMRLLYCQA